MKPPAGVGKTKKPLRIRDSFPCGFRFERRCFLCDPSLDRGRQTGAVAEHEYKLRARCLTRGEAEPLWAVDREHRHGVVPAALRPLV